VRGGIGYSEIGKVSTVFARGSVWGSTRTASGWRRFQDEVIVVSTAGGREKRIGAAAEPGHGYVGEIRV
jgi:hypothetical protein